MSNTNAASQEENDNNRLVITKPVADELGYRSVYRGTITPYQDTFNHGFVSKGSCDDLIKHVLSNHPDSGFISTSISKNVATQFPLDGFEKPDPRYVYEIRTNRPGILVARTIATAKEKDFRYLRRFANEREVSFFLEIDSTEIKGCWKVETVMDVTINPSDLLKTSSDDLRLVGKRVIQKQYISNPRYKSPGITKWAAAGYVITAMGAAVDGHSLYSEYKHSTQTGNYTNTYVEAARITAGWSGAFTMGSLFASRAFLYSSALSPPNCGNGCRWMYWICFGILWRKYHGVKSMWFR